jgi:hypothetical protein
MSAFSNPSRTTSEEAIINMFSESVLRYEKDQDKPLALVRKIHAKHADEKLKEFELRFLTTPRAGAKKLLEYRQIQLAFRQMSRSFT